MRHVAAPWLVVGAVGLGLVYPMVRAVAQPKPLTEKQRALIDIVALSQKLDGPETAKEAARIVRENDSCNISVVFRPRQNGGLGIGKAVKAGHRDSVENMVIDLATKKTTTEAQLEEFQSDYVHVAKVLQAMAELAPHRGPEFTGNNAEKAKKWADVSAAFKADTAAFRKALEEKDPKKVRTTAGKLHQTCNNCHDVRDS